MAQHFADIGLIINEYDYVDELGSIIEEFEDTSRLVQANDKSYLVVTIDEHIELWFRILAGNVDLDSVEPHYRTGNVKKLSSPDWVYLDDFGMSGLLKGKINGEPINLNISSAALVPALGASDEPECEIAAFAESLSVYEDSEDFAENCEYGDTFSEKSYIPTGCYDSFGKDDITQTPRAIVSGVVKSVETLENTYTQEEYLVINIESAHTDFTVLASPDMLYDDVVPGNIVMGKLWFTGRVIC